MWFITCYKTALLATSLSTLSPSQTLACIQFRFFSIITVTVCPLIHKHTIQINYLRDVRQRITSRLATTSQPAWLTPLYLAQFKNPSCQSAFLLDITFTQLPLSSLLNVNFKTDSFLHDVTILGQFSFTVHSRLRVHRKHSLSNYNRQSFKSTKILKNWDF